MSDEVLIEELRTAMRGAVEDIEVPSAVVARVLDAPPRRRLRFGWVMPAVAVGVAVVVAVVALSTLVHRSSPSHHPSGRVPVAARGLVSRLAVLRRPQRPADVLSRSTIREIESLSYRARVIRGMSRRVGLVKLGRNGSAGVYLVVQAPPHFPVHAKRPAPPLLSPRLGDQASIVFVGPFREGAAINHPSVADGAQPVAATQYGLTASPGQVNSVWGAEASIVPDGVTRVEWVFGGRGTGSAPRRVWPKIHDNVALGNVPPRLETFLTGAAWYGSHGRLISSFGDLSAAANFRRALDASVLQRVDRALLAHFAVLGKKNLGYPGLDQAEAASLIEPNPLGLNTRRERFVADPSGPAKVFVVPGSQGIALLWVSPGVGQAEGGTGDALSGSLVVVGPRLSGHRLIVGLAPDGNRAVRVLLRHGRTLSVPVVDNVYAVRVPASARTVILRNAAGRIVHVRIA